MYVQHTAFMKMTFFCGGGGGGRAVVNHNALTAETSTNTEREQYEDEVVTFMSSF